MTISELKIGKSRFFHDRGTAADDGQCSWLNISSFLSGRLEGKALALLLLVKKTLTLMRLVKNRCNLRLFFCLWRTFQLMY